MTASMCFPSGMRWARFSSLGVIVFTIGISGCSPAPPAIKRAASGASARQQIKQLPAKLRVRQRSTVHVPESEGQLSITADDITRGQVMITVVAATGSPLLGPISMKEHDVRDFEFRKHRYSLELTELENVLVGDDFASFVIKGAAEAVSEYDKIGRLIHAVEAMDKAVFIRNGSEYDGEDAADHLRRKLSAAGGQIESATDFIDQIASRSSMTGADYKIRLPEGRTVLARDFFNDRLSKVEASR